MKKFIFFLLFISACIKPSTEALEPWKPLPKWNHQFRIGTDASEMRLWINGVEQYDYLKFYKLYVGDSIRIWATGTDWYDTLTGFHEGFLNIDLLKNEVPIISEHCECDVNIFYINK